jgi:hypothetical protein
VLPERIAWRARPRVEKELDMVALTKRRFDQPDNVLRYPRAAFDVIRMNGSLWWRMTLEPGWRYSESLGRSEGSERCPGEHLFMFVLSGRIALRMHDGTELEFGPGDVGSIPPDHESWVVGPHQVIAIGIDSE